MTNQQLTIHLLFTYSIRPTSYELLKVLPNKHYMKPMDHKSHIGMASNQTSCFIIMGT